MLSKQEAEPVGILKITLKLSYNTILMGTFRIENTSNFQKSIFPLYLEKLIHVWKNWDK